MSEDKENKLPREDEEKRTKKRSHTETSFCLLSCSVNEADDTNRNHSDNDKPKNLHTSSHILNLVIHFMDIHLLFATPFSLFVPFFFLLFLRCLPFNFVIFTLSYDAMPPSQHPCSHCWRAKRRSPGHFTTTYAYVCV